MFKHSSISFLYLCPLQNIPSCDFSKFIFLLIGELQILFISAKDIQESETLCLN